MHDPGYRVKVLRPRDREKRTVVGSKPDKVSGWRWAGNHELLPGHSCAESRVEFVGAGNIDSGVVPLSTHIGEAPCKASRFVGFLPKRRPKAIPVSAAVSNQRFTVFVKLCGYRTWKGPWATRAMLSSIGEYANSSCHEGIGMRQTGAATTGPPPPQGFVLWLRLQKQNPLRCL